ncbi:OmpA family protein [Falsiroseomonas sp. HW251]|uniref:OmpA family protein n=1 Tax=Falsiroseomonas sp. HW251 TaxID=3390998 RepID=UPI003D31DADC
MPRHRLAVAALLLAPGLAAAQEAATGAVTIERQAPPRPAVIEQGGVPIGTVAPGQAVEVQGANVVVVEEGPRVTRLTLRNDVLFDFDKAELRPEAAEALNRVAAIIRERKPSSVSIVGHTDSVGSDSYNQALSERRARSVEQWLEAHEQGLPPMQASGRGESDPVAPNTIEGRDNPEGRQRNRRVDVLLQR